MIDKLLDLPYWSELDCEISNPEMEKKIVSFSYVYIFMKDPDSHRNTLSDLNVLMKKLTPIDLNNVDYDQLKSHLVGRIIRALKMNMCPSKKLLSGQPGLSLEHLNEIDLFNKKLGLVSNLQRIFEVSCAIDKTPNKHKRIKALKEEILRLEKIL